MSMLTESMVLDSPTSCSTNPDLFFAESPMDVNRARELCRDCPIRAACLQGAIERAEPCGVWGGELFLRGEIVPSKRARGRPRQSTKLSAQQRMDQIVSYLWETIIRLAEQKGDVFTISVSQLFQAYRDDHANDKANDVYFRRARENLEAAGRIRITRQFNNGPITISVLQLPAADYGDHFMATGA